MSNHERQRRFQGLPLFGLILSAFALAACNGPPPETRVLPDTDLVYVKRLADPGVPLTLNLSDPRQYGFLRQQLEAAGVHSGDLATQVGGLRSVHDAKSPPATLTLLQKPGTFGEFHPFGAITQLFQNGQGSYHAEAWLAIPDVYHATLLLQLFDTTSWTPIGDLVVVQDWLEEFVLIEADGSLAEGNVGAVFTYLYDADDALPPVAQVVFEVLGEDVDPAFSGVNPSKQQAGNNCAGSSPSVSSCVKICGPGRTATDCDYQATGTPTNRDFPVSGSVSGFSPALASTAVANASMYIVDAQNGGCQANTQPGQIQVDVGSNAVAWDFGNQIFAAACLTSNVSNFHFSFTVNTGTPTVVEVVSDNNAPAFGQPCNPNDGTTCQVPPLFFVFGCLPGGTPVRLADGSLEAIEAIEVGDRVIADATGRVLTVIDTLRGQEEEPLVAVVTDDGFTLRLTETHPVVTDRGVMLAKQLQEGDVLTTESGPSTITGVSEEVSEIAVPVFNLNLGAANEAVTEDNTTFFAAGVLVGDNRMQGTFERGYETGGAAAHEIPAEWQGDYQRWVEAQSGEGEAAN